MTSVLVWATVVGTFLNVPVWVGVFLVGLTGLSFLAFLVPYIYLMIYDREALRREKLVLKDPSTKQLDTPNPHLLANPAQVDPTQERELTFIPADPPDWR